MLDSQCITNLLTQIGIKIQTGLWIMAVWTMFQFAKQNGLNKSLTLSPGELVSFFFGNGSQDSVLVSAPRTSGAVIS